MAYVGIASNLIAPALCLSDTASRRVSWVRKQHRRVDRSNFERTDDACSSYAGEAVLVTMDVDTLTSSTQELDFREGDEHHLHAVARISVVSLWEI